MREHLTILDLSDREFILVMLDGADEDGYTTSAEVTARLDLKDSRIASSRMSWLVRLGAAEREHARDAEGKLRYHLNGKAMHTQRWRPTELGLAIAQGKLRKGTQSALDRLKAGDMLLVTKWLAEHSAGDSGLGRMVQREWRYGHGK